MQVIESLQIKEKLYKEELENGLTVFVIPKKGIRKKYVMWATYYGSNDNHFIDPKTGEEVVVPVEILRMY